MAKPGNYPALYRESKRFHRDDSEHVFGRHWNDGTDVLVEISRRDDGYGETWTMTCAFMMGDRAMCSCDVQDGEAADCFEKLAMRMIGA